MKTKKHAWEVSQWVGGTLCRYTQKASKGGREIEMKEQVNESGITKSSRVSEVEEGFNLVGNSTIHKEFSGAYVAVNWSILDSGYA